MNVQQEETRAESREQALADYDVALTVFTQDKLPGMYAQVHMQRGLAYTQRLQGERTENLEQAIERSGTKAGNKGYDAAISAIEMANLMKALD